MKAWPFLGVFFIQGIILLAHWFLFRTWIAFWPGPGPESVSVLRTVLLILAFSFVVAALLSFRFSNFVVKLVYTIAATWLGFLNYFFLAACLTWPAWYAMLIFRVPDAGAARPWIAAGFFILAVLAGVYGMLNARWVRVRRIQVSLPNLPEFWHGRKALLMSDLHLGNINGVRFARRLVKLANGLRPEIIFIPGDLFDGTTADLDKLIAPFKKLSAPSGAYFSTGNHEEFRDTEHYLEAVIKTGIKVLANERVTLEGLHILGIPYGDSAFPIRVRSTLAALSPGPGEASILLNHVPVRLPIVEQAGISLQVSGHTHGGQIFPYNWLVPRIYGKFTHGLHCFGSLQVYTSTGAGTWGPPMRVGTQPEVVVLEFAGGVRS